MRVYRVETLYGEGAYSDTVYTRLERRENRLVDIGEEEGWEAHLPSYYLGSAEYSDRHPSPRMCGIEDIRESEKFCFISPEMLAEWFFIDPERDPQNLQDTALYVSEYEAPDVRIGERQAVFETSTATRVRRVTPTQFKREMEEA